MTKVKLSIVVLSYNTKKLLADCLKSLAKVKNEVDFEVIVPDNGSQDGSLEMVRRSFPWVRKIVDIGQNRGFAVGNNTARPFVRGKYILFLNSDTVVQSNTLRETVKYLDNNAEVGALTCKIILPSGQLDKDARRSFITPWIGLTHLYLKLDRLFPKSKLLAKYWYGYMSENVEHEVDVIQGAYFLTRKSILDKVDWFDEDYFLDGEDIDLCWKIKEAGWKIVYYPKVFITHYKGASKGKIKQINKISFEEKLKYRMTGVDSMEKFVKKRLSKKYPLLFTLFVLTGIKLLKLLRYLEVRIKG